MAEWQNGDEGKAKKRKYLDNGAGGVWFGYCVVHMFTYGRFSDLNVGPMSLRPWLAR